MKDEDPNSTKNTEEALKNIDTITFITDPKNIPY